MCTGKWPATGILYIVKTSVGRFSEAGTDTSRLSARVYIHLTVSSLNLQKTGIGT